MSRPDLVTARTRWRWWHAVQGVLTLVVAGATAAIVGLAAHNGALIGRITIDVSQAQERATNLSNAQRESLRLLQEVTELGRGGDADAVAVRRGLLGQQLRVSASLFPASSWQAGELDRMQARLVGFPWERLGRSNGDAELLRGTGMALVSQIEVRIKGLYDEQEGYSYRATLEALEAKRGSQHALVLLVVLVLALGVCWVVALTRRTRDFSRAYQALVSEVAERRAAESALRASEERFRSLVQRSSDLIVVTDAAGTISYVSPAVQTILGFHPDHLVGRSLLDYLHPGDRTEVEDLLATLAGESSGVGAAELRMKTGNGTWRAMEALWRDLRRDPAVRGIVWNARDVTDRRALQDQLSHQAFHDALTALPNRAMFLRLLEEALQGDEQSGRCVSAVLIDLDGFKKVNDTLGHAAGDELLRRVAERLQGCVLDGDTAARIGGDEFALIIPSGVPEHAIAVCRRVIDVLHRPILVAGQEVTVGASIGVAHRDTHVAAEDLLADADIAMYVAKSRGKGRYEVFEQSMRERTTRRTRMEQQLARAAELGEIEVHYQPIVDLATGTVTALEALARWRHPDGALVPPAVFVPIAEESGVIVEIGREVLRQACRTVRRWRESVPASENLSVTVNVSGQQLNSGTLAGHVREALAESGLAPSALVLELTESFLLETSETAAAELAQIRALGVRLAMDDFGSGYSSLPSLLELDVDMLKIDRTLLDFDTAGQGSLMGAVADLGRTLHLIVVAEGVETAEHLAHVRAAGCHSVQGYYLARPLVEAAAGSFLERAATTNDVAALLDPDRTVAA